MRLIRTASPNTNTGDAAGWSIVLVVGLLVMTPLDVEAVVFNLRRMLDSPLRNPATSPFPLDALSGNVELVEAAGALAARVRLKKPFAPFLSNLAHPSALLVSPTVAKQWGSDYGQHPVGTGPYRFVDWEPWQRVLLERNGSYHEAPPRLMHLVFRPLAELMARVAELVTDGVDVASDWIEVASWSGNLVALDRVPGLTLEPSSLLDLPVVWQQR